MVLTSCITLDKTPEPSYGVEDVVCFQCVIAYSEVSDDKFSECEGSKVKYLQPSDKEWQAGDVEWPETAGSARMPNA
jgi:hypothetical protein